MLVFNYIEKYKLKIKNALLPFFFSILKLNEN